MNQAFPLENGPTQRVLFVDYFLPAFDRSAGNQRTLELLRLIRRFGCAVTFLARNGECQKRYQDALTNLGIETLATDPDHLTLWDYKPGTRRIDFEHLLPARDFSVVILSRWENAELYIPLIKKWLPKARIIIDSVDLHFNRGKMRLNLYPERGGESELQKQKEREVRVYRQADALIAATEEEAALLRNEVPGVSGVYVVPTMYNVMENPPSFAQRHDLLFVGNFAHSPNSDALVYFCGEIFPKIQEHLKETRLYIVGANASFWMNDLAQPNIVVAGYLPSLLPMLCSARISVAPLRYGAGMKGKIVEAMAAGLPVVTTSTGAAGLSLVDEQNAMIADDAAGFAQRVVRLYEDENLWKRLQTAGLDLVRRSLTPQVVAPVIRKILS
jgi:glycosyltransferase involved in cell wall biosynthesis